MNAAAPGIAVSGVGVVKARPDQLRIEVKVQGKAEIADDALVKYRDARRRLTDALDKLKLPNLRASDQAISLTTGGSGGSYMAMMNGVSQGDSSSPLEVSGNLQLELSGLAGQAPEDILKTMGKVLDAIKDAGANFGPSSAESMMAMRFGMETPVGLKIKFMVHDFKNVREQAYQLAVEDARARALRLAKLNGLKLGRVTAVQEVQVAGDAPEASRQMPWYWGGGNSDRHEQNEISTETLTDVPVTVRLLVRFDIAEQP